MTRILNNFSPSVYDCGADYNLDDEGNCTCWKCRKAKWKMEKYEDYELWRD